jgi:PAP2 superfamily protein
MRRNRRLHCLFSMAILGILLSAAFAVNAQTHSPSPDPTASPTPSLERKFIKNILGDQKAIWTAPLHLHSSDAKWTLPLGIGTMALITTDRITGDEMAEFDRQVKASRIISYGGSVYGAGATIGTFYLLGRTKHNARARETGILSAEASIDGFIVSNALKGATQRGRPLSGIDRSEFFDGGNSFPSGHSIQAWSVATVIANEYHDHRLVQVAAYGAATAVGLARFTGHNHYLSEVLVGSALGYGIGQYVYHTHHRASLDSTDEDETVKTSRWPAITPEWNRGLHKYGAAFTWSF